MSYDEHYFENEVKNILKKGHIRQRDLIEIIQNAHRRDDGSIEYGYNKKTIYKKLRDLAKQGVIEKVENPNLKKLGIEEEDKRFVYVTLAPISEIKKHMDNIIKDLGSEDNIEQTMALKEIVRYEQTYILTPIQLDSIVTEFNKTIDKEYLDDDLTNKLLLLLYEYIFEKDIKPINREKITDLLKRLLRKYPIPVSTHVNLRTHIIHLLGYYESELVIERLMEDARTLKDLSSIETDYKTIDIARLIEKKREKLYALELELAKEGNENASGFISKIRTSALINLGLHKGYSKGDDSW